jgi:arsenate reductase
MNDRVFNVLFLCTGNSARSILAEAILAKAGKGRFRAYSAGSFPHGKVNPHAVELLGSMGYETSEFRSKSWNEFAEPDAPKMDFVFTVCDSAANEVCPVWPGHPMSAHWGVPDPAAVEGTDTEKRLAFAEAFKMLRNRISIFVNLPVQSLDRMSLQRRIDEIGTSLPDTA